MKFRSNSCLGTHFVNFMGYCIHWASKEIAVKMYSDMVTLQIMDTIFYEAQRQGRLSFYLTSNGEEAINIASAAAVSPHDVILPQVYICVCVCI